MFISKVVASLLILTLFIISLNNFILLTFSSEASLTYKGWYWLKKGAYAIYETNTTVITGVNGTYGAIVRTWQKETGGWRGETGTKVLNPGLTIISRLRIKWEVIDYNLTYIKIFVSAEFFNITKIYNASARKAIEIKSPSIRCGKVFYIDINNLTLYDGKEVIQTWIWFLNHKYIKEFEEKKRMKPSPEEGFPPSLNITEDTVRLDVSEEGWPGKPFKISGPRAFELYIKMNDIMLYPWGEPYLIRNITFLNISSASLPKERLIEGHQEKSAMIYDVISGLLLKIIMGGLIGPGVGVFIDGTLYRACGINYVTTYGKFDPEKGPIHFPAELVLVETNIPLEQPIFGLTNFKEEFPVFHNYLMYIAVIVFLTANVIYLGIRVRKS